jgi:hypothetical protein
MESGERVGVTEDLRMIEFLIAPVVEFTGEEIFEAYLNGRVPDRKIDAVLVIETCEVGQGTREKLAALLGHPVSAADGSYLVLPLSTGKLPALCSRLREEIPHLMLDLWLRNASGRLALSRSDLF